MNSYTMLCSIYLSIKYYVFILIQYPQLLDLKNLIISGPRRLRMFKQHIATSEILYLIRLLFDNPRFPAKHANAAVRGQKGKIV